MEIVIIIIVIGVFLLYKLTIAIHKFFFYESIQRKARELPIEDLRNARNYFREIACHAHKTDSQSPREVRQAKSHAQ